MLISSEILDSLTAQAKASPRLRMNFDLRTSPEDSSQRMLNAIQPGSPLLNHRQLASSKTVVCLKDRLDEVFYEVVNECEALGTSHCVDFVPRWSVREVKRIHLDIDGDFRTNNSRHCNKCSRVAEARKTIEDMI